MNERYECSPQGTVAMIDLLGDRLDDTEFRQMHHLGGSKVAHRSYCTKVMSFRSNSRNREVNFWLQKKVNALR